MFLTVVTCLKAVISRAYVCIFTQYDPKVNVYGYFYGALERCAYIQTLNYLNQQMKQSTN